MYRKKSNLLFIVDVTAKSKKPPKEEPGALSMHKVVYTKEWSSSDRIEVAKKIPKLTKRLTDRSLCIIRLLLVIKKHCFLIFVISDESCC